jgi:methylphosphotriester-DNA--protein-cysteine methyltransferase
MRAGACQGACVNLDSDRVWQAIEACDPRFDGWVFCARISSGERCG